MRYLYQLGFIALLTSTLAACSTSGAREEHLYVFGKTPSSNNAIPNVIASTAVGSTGPENTLHTVYFDYDKYDIRDADRPILASHAQWLQQNPQRHLILSGHTDARGGAEYNLALGQKRAESVRSALQIMGIDPARIDAISYGKERLAQSGTSEQDHQLNRRVEFEYR